MRIPANSSVEVMTNLLKCMACHEELKHCTCIWAAIRGLQTFREETTGKLNELFKMTGEGLSDLDKRIESVEQNSTAPYPYDEEYKAIVTLAANYKAQLAIACEERDQQKSNAQFWYNCSDKRKNELIALHLEFSELKGQYDELLNKIPTPKDKRPNCT